MNNKEKRHVGSQKLWRYYFELLDNDDIQLEIKKLREKHGIPEKGYEVHEKANIYVFPDQWQGDGNQLEKDLDKMTRKLNVPIEPISWPHPFEIYLFYNKKILPEWSHHYDLCVLEHSGMYKGSKEARQHRNDRDKVYPIILQISPYASLRDILDFINGNSKKIEHLKKKFSKNIPLIGKIRKKKPLIQERDEYIYQNRNVPAVQLAKDVKDRFGGSVTYHAIDQIKHTMRKKRGRSIKSS